MCSLFRWRFELNNFYLHLTIKIHFCQIYLNRFKYHNAEHSDLWDALTEAVPTELVDSAGKPFSVKQFAKHWTEQTGYPVVKVNISDLQTNLFIYLFIVNIF